MKLLKLLIPVIIVSCFAACEKDNSLNYSSGLKILKMYGDTVISGDNPGFNITSRNDRIFMTYGYKYYYMSANGLADYTSLQPAVMATDGRGNFLWKSVLPPAFEECGIAALDDGGCIVASQISFSENISYSQSAFYLFHFNPQGLLIKTDSISFSQFSTVNNLFNNYINAIRTSQGKIIFYGDYFGGNPASSRGFAFEYSPTSGLVWFKEYAIPFDGNTQYDMMLQGCVETDDHSLLYCGSATYFNSTSGYRYGMIIMKTTLTGDTLWSRIYDGGSSYYKESVAKSTEGNFFIACNNPNTTQGYIVMISANGDSLKTVQTGIKQYISSLVSTSNGGCMALINSSPYSCMNFTIDPKYFQENTLKIDFDDDLNILDKEYFQVKASDFIPVATRTEAGDIACFGVFNAIGKTYNLPHLYLLR